MSITTDIPVTSAIVACNSTRRALTAAARRLALLLVMIALMGGCGEEIDGTYEDPDGQAKLEFRERNRVYFTFMGTTVRGEYELDGDHVIITGNGASHVLKRSGDTIEGFGPLELKLTRVEPTH